MRGVTAALSLLGEGSALSAPVRVLLLVRLLLVLVLRAEEAVPLLLSSVEVEEEEELVEDVVLQLVGVEPGGSLSRNQQPQMLHFGLVHLPFCNSTAGKTSSAAGGASIGGYFLVCRLRPFASVAEGHMSLVAALVHGCLCYQHRLGGCGGPQQHGPLRATAASFAICMVT